MAHGGSGDSKLSCSVRHALTVALRFAESRRRTERQDRRARRRDPFVAVVIVGGPVRAVEDHDTKRQLPEIRMNARYRNSFENYSSQVYFHG